MSNFRYFFKPGILAAMKNEVNFFVDKEETARYITFNI